MLILPCSQRGKPLQWNGCKVIHLSLTYHKVSSQEILCTRGNHESNSKSQFASQNDMPQAFSKIYIYKWKEFNETSKETIWRLKLVCKILASIISIDFSVLWRESFSLSGSVILPSLGSPSHGSSARTLRSISASIWTSVSTQWSWSEFAKKWFLFFLLHVSWSFMGSEVPILCLLSACPWAASINWISTEARHCILLYPVFFLVENYHWDTLLLFAIFFTFHN